VVKAQLLVVKLGDWLQAFPIAAVG